MLEKGAVLTDNIIRLLVNWKISKIAINSLIEGSISALDNALAEQKIFEQDHQELVDAVKDSFDKIRYLKQLPVEEITGLARKCVASLVKKTCAIKHLAAIKNTDDSTYRHSVNVSVLCGLIGKWSNLSDSQLEEIVLTGLLHDVGKTQIPLEILTKPDKLSIEEMEYMKLHPKLGYDLLTTNSNFSDTVTQCVLFHHERMDGSGYPASMPGGKIPSAAKMMAVADVYDAMTSNRFYQSAVTPFSVISEFSSAMFDKLDPATCSLLLDNFSCSLNGCIVMLSDQSVATVVHIDKTRLDKPSVLTLDGRTYINLADRNDLQIIGIIG